MAPASREIAKLVNTIEKRILVAFLPPIKPGVTTKVSIQKKTQMRLAFDEKKENARVTNKK